MMYKAIQLGDIIFNKCTMKIEKLYVKRTPPSPRQLHFSENHSVNRQRLGKLYRVWPEEDASAVFPFGGAIFVP